MPKSVPLRAITVTTVEPGMPAAAPGLQLAGRHHQVEEEVVVAGRRTAPPRRRRRSGQSGVDHRRAAPRAGTSASRPGCGCGPRRPSAPSGATIALTSTGPAARTACCSSGPSTSVIQCSRSITSGAVGAVAQHLAEPLVERAPRLVRRSARRAGEHPHRRRDHAGHRPDRAAVVARLPARPVAGGERALGLAPAWRPGPRTASRRSARRASGRTPAPSSTGGPACRNWPALAARAPPTPGSTSTRCACAAEHRLPAPAALAATRRGSAITAGHATPGRPAGGRQSTADDVDGLLHAGRRRTSRRRR